MPSDKHASTSGRSGGHSGGHPGPAIDALLDEARLYPPAPDFTKQANVHDASIYTQAEADPEGFWEKCAAELDWFVRWNRVLEWTVPDAKWFVGGKLNASYNCLDRHVRGARKNKAALIWVGEPGDRRTLTYWDLYREVNKFANALRKLGVARGDRVAIYMPMVPEAAVAMLACARIGAVHSVVFGGFSAEALRDRINDASAKVLVTADGGYRRGQILSLKHDADEALLGTPIGQLVGSMSETKTVREVVDALREEYTRTVESLPRDARRPRASLNASMPRPP